VHDPEQQAFLETVVQTSRSRWRKLTTRSVLWRAQVGVEEDDEEPRPFSPERMRPLANRAKEGRANPQGIPYLYLASQRETAMKEVRPWIGSYISVAQFKMIRTLRVVNFVMPEDKPGASNPLDHMYFDEEPSPEKREQAVWSQIDLAFARPVDRNDDTADYAPTQILAELFKSKGFDGIAYRSSLGKGYNIVLFDTEAARLTNCFLFKAESVEFEFNEVANPYYVSAP